MTHLADEAAGSLDGVNIILGGSGGIGACVARQLTAKHQHVVIAGRNEERLRAVSQQLQCRFQIVDATSVESVSALFEMVQEQQGVISGVVNCVGSMLLKPAHLTTQADWDSTVASNLTSAFATVRAAAKTMKSGGGSVVLMSSSAARIGLPNHEAIAAAKAGVIGLVQSAAASYASRGIRFNAIAPGLVRTPLTQKIWENETSAEMSRSMHALGRLGEAEEIASLIVWLLSDQSSWVTGETIGFDGGLSTVKAQTRRR